MRGLGKLAKGSLFLAVLIVAAFLLLRSQLASNQACAIARSRLPALLGSEVRIGRCEIDPIARTVALYQVSVFSGEAAAVVSAESVKVRLDAFRPFLGITELGAVQVDRPRVAINLIPEQGAKRAARHSKCDLSALKRVRVERLELTGGEIEVKQGDQTLELGDLSVSWSTQKDTATFQMAADRGQATLRKGSPLSLGPISAEGKLNLRDQHLELQPLSLGVDAIRLALRGSIDDFCDPKVSLQGHLSFPVKSAAPVLGFQGPLQGVMSADLAVSGRPSDPILSVHLQGQKVRVGRFTPGDFSGRFLYTGGDLRVDELVLGFGPGSAKVRGKVTLAKNFPAEFEVTPNGAQFAKILDNVGLHGAWVDFAASGRVLVSGHFLPKPSLSGEADIRVSQFLVAARAFDAPRALGRDVFGFSQGHVTLGVRILHDRVEMHHVKGETGGTHFTGYVTLFYNTNRGIAAEGFADPLDLSDFGRIAELRASGRGQVHAEINGGYDSIQIQSTLNLRELGFWRFALGNVEGKLNYRDGLMSFSDLTAQKGRTTYTGSGNLHFLKESRTTWNVQVAKGRSEDIVDTVVGLDPRFRPFQRVLTGDATGSVQFDGAIENLDGKIQFALANLKYYGRPLGNGKLSVRLVNGDSLVVDQAMVQGPVGKLSGQGSLTFDGPVAFHFKGDEIQLREAFGAERGGQLGVGGTLAIAGQVQGDSKAPEVTAHLTSPNVVFADRDLGEAHLEARIQGDDFQLWGTPFGDARTSAKVVLEAPYPYSANLTMQLPEIRPLLPKGAASQGLSGTLSGTIKADGDLADLASSAVTATLSKLRLSRPELAAENAGPLLLNYSEGRLTVSAFAMRGPNTELSITGWAGPSAIDMKANGTLDVRLLEGFVPTLERTGGRIELSASATGSLKEPSYFGSIDVRDARFSIRDQSFTMRGLSGRLDFSEARMLLQDFHGILNGGRASLRGSVELQQLAVKSVDLTIHLEDVSLKPIEDLPAVVAGELALSGKPGALRLTGDLDVLKLRYERPVTLEKLLPEIQRGRGQATFEAPREWLTFDVGLHAKGDIRLENNVAKARLVGDLRLTGTNVHPGLIGSIQSTEGSQAFFRGNQFAIRQGLLEFRDRKAVETIFDVRADTQVREYLIRLHAFGRPADPKVVLSSEPQLPEGDILSLLTLGVISKDKSNTAGAGAGLAAEALFNASGLDRQVQHFLPKNPLLKDLSFHIATVYNDATGIVEPNALLESKFLTEQLKLRLTQPVSGRGTKAQAEYRFDDRLSAQAQWDNEHIDYSIGNWGLNLKLHWEVD
jgi:translocation and assembly module TamB